MTPDAGVTRMTSKQAKKAYQKRGLVQLSEQERKQIARRVELEKRADAIREKERRKKENAQKRADKEAKQREERRRMGIDEPAESLKVDSRQTRMDGFFQKGGGVTIESGAKTGQEDSDLDDNEVHTELHGQEVTSAHHGSHISDLGGPNELELNDESGDMATVPYAVKSNEAGDAAFTIPRKFTDIETKRQKRKRKDLSRVSSAVSDYSRPIRMPLRMLDRNLQVNKEELWVPPSQNTAQVSKEVDVEKLRDPLPRIPWPFPQDFMSKSGVRLDCEAPTGCVERSRGDIDGPQTLDAAPKDFEFPLSQLSITTNELTELFDHEQQRESQQGEDREPELPAIPTNPELRIERVSNLNEREIRDVDDDALRHLVDLFSDDSVFCIEEEANVDGNAGDKRGLRRTTPKFHTEVNGGDKIADKKRQDLPGFDIGIELSSFSPSDILTSDMLAKADSAPKRGDSMAPAEDQDLGTDPLEISREDAESLEQAALVATRMESDSRSPTTSVASLSAESIQMAPIDVKRCTSVSGDRHLDDAAKNLNESFGYGGFDFSTQELRDFS